MPLVARMRLQAAAERRLMRRDTRRDEKWRILAAKVLSALVPTSLDSIRRLLAMSDGRYAYEVHFSLFVFLADVEHLNVSKAAVGLVIDVIGNYLRNVRVSTASAAWMAAHALGGHFDSPSARQVLFELSERAKWSAGRAAAIKGLAEAHLDRRRLGPRLLPFLEHVATADRSERVRICAQLALTRLMAKKRS